MSKPTPNDLDVTLVPFDELIPFPGNARKGDVPKIKASMLRHGVFTPLTVQRSTNHVIIGNHRLKAMRELHAEQPARFGGHAPVLYVDVDDLEASKMNLDDNDTSDAAEWERRLLAEQLAGIADADGDLHDVGFDDERLDDLVNSLEEDTYDVDRETQYEEGAAAKPVRREMPLDLIFSSSGEATRGMGLVAFSMGWNPGIISTYVNSARLYRDRFPKGKPVMFMDNEWHGYDHAAHVEAVAEFKPKYATTRDIMTRQQCEETGVEFYTLEQILGMAADVAQHAENIILIPKYDCIDKLPREIAGKRVVLGISVPSSYGGTMIPPERFKGWPVHLLGGPWKKQRALLNVLRDDVVSLDNNNVLMTSRFASVSMPDGTTQNILDVLPYRLEINHMPVTLVLSLANIVSEVHAIYGVDVPATADEEIVAMTEEEIDNER